ncbi:MAG: hypothetical protein J6X56_00580 [Ruminococcus sp.]|nr:hypothetical protein [Ruminococcus sp.]
MSNNGAPGGLDNFLENFNDINTEKTFAEADVKKHYAIAIIAYLLPFLFFLPICMDGNSTYNKFHANQSLTWLIVAIVLGVVFAILGLIPFFGVVFRILWPFVILGIDFVYGYGAYKGKAYRMPFVGSLLNAF